MIILAILCCCLSIFSIYLFCLGGRTGHKDLHKLCGWKYAHRGLHNAERPENSMAAFRAALEHGYGIELDIHLMKDGNLAVIHDSTLKRVAGADVNIEDLTLEDLPNYTLGNSMEQIPLFSQVLDLYRGKAPLIVELKCVGNNHAALCEAALEMLDRYDGLFCMESFDPRVTRWLRKNRPDIIRGQLSENWMKSSLKLPWVLKFAMTYHISNIYTRPDFIAYKYADRKAFGTEICRKFWDIQGVSWTLKTPQEYETAVEEGWIPIFEGFEP
jgi:glycerophosphoryl diester phosphodiesterase